MEEVGGEGAEREIIRWPYATTFEKAKEEGDSQGGLFACVAKRPQRPHTVYWENQLWRTTQQQDNQSSYENPAPSHRSQR